MSAAALEAQDDFLRDVIEGLSAAPKYLPGKYLWDERGLSIFDEICQSAPYYPTHREIALLSKHAADIARIVGPHASIVEMGSGASHKIRILLEALETPKRYVAIDISRDFLKAAAARIQSAYPHVEVVQICADYMLPFPALPASDGGGVLGFFPGISIGNMNAADAIGLLARIRHALGRGWLLISQDLNTDAVRFDEAYASALMGSFHKNILHRLIRELGATIAVDHFEHAVRLADAPSRVEAHLVASEPTEIVIDGHTIPLAAGESIRTDQSLKYSQAEFLNLLTQAGWTEDRIWSDADHVFGLYLMQAQS